MLPVYGLAINKYSRILMKSSKKSSVYRGQTLQYKLSEKLWDNLFYIRNSISLYQMEKRLMFDFSDNKSRNFSYNANVVYF